MKITIFTYGLNMSRKIVAVKYWLVKFFTTGVKLHHAELRIRHGTNIIYRAFFMSNECFSHSKNKSTGVKYI